MQHLEPIRYVVNGRHTQMCSPGPTLDFGHGRSYSGSELPFSECKHTMAAANYKPYDPNHPTPVQLQLSLKLAGMSKNSPVIIRGFGSFSVVVHSGFKKVNYQAHIRDDGLYFWVNEEHAKQIGLALRPTLEYFCIEVSLCSNWIENSNTTLYKCMLKSVFDGIMKSYNYYFDLR